MTGVLEGSNVTLDVLDVRRAALKKHHSATHLLHAALRQVLGKHVVQKGSLVAPDRLRFDFSHFAALTTDELGQVEKLVNQVIQQAVPILTEEMSQTKARDAGAMALFGENYGDSVRVVTMGNAVDKTDKDFKQAFSKSSAEART